MLSHLPHLVQLNRTRVRFPSWCGSFGHQKQTKQAYHLLEEDGLGTLSNEPWSGLFVVRMRSDLKQTQLQKELCIFGLTCCSQLHYALWDEEVFVDSLQFSMANLGL